MYVQYIQHHVLYRVLVACTCVLLLWCAIIIACNYIMYMYIKCNINFLDVFMRTMCAIQYTCTCTCVIIDVHPCTQVLNCLKVLQALLCCYKSVQVKAQALTCTCTCTHVHMYIKIMLQALSKHQKTLLIGFFFKHQSAYPMSN